MVVTLVIMTGSRRIYQKRKQKGYGGIYTRKKQGGYGLEKVRKIVRKYKDLSKRATGMYHGYVGPKLRRKIRSRAAKVVRKMPRIVSNIIGTASLIGAARKGSSR